MRETGSCAPTSAHPTPSRSRYLARSRTLAGTSVSVVAESQVARRPVGPAGSVAARPASAASDEVTLEVAVVLIVISRVVVHRGVEASVIGACRARIRQVDSPGGQSRWTVRVGGRGQ